MKTSRTLQLTEELIALDSITPQDKGCQQRLSDLLAPLGFHCETIESNGVTNLWARRGTASPVFVFAGHTDVVPAGPLDQWAFPALRPDPPRRQAVRPRRLRHEDLDRGHGGRRRGVRRCAPGPCRLDRLPDHQRRGRPGRGWHRGRLRDAGRARRDPGLLPGRRADLQPRAGRHDQERPPRLAVRLPGGQGRAGPHRLSAPGAQSRSTRRRRPWPNWRPRYGTTGTSTFPPTSWQVSNIAPAPAPTTSSRAR
jgi:hypothetical protein